MVAIGAILTVITLNATALNTLGKDVGGMAQNNMQLFILRNY